MRVLIVDDCRDSADSLFMLTQLWGHDSVAVYDGLAALDLFEALRPDVMLVDIGMPGMDGTRIARAVARCGAPRPTLVAVSGFGDRAHRRAAAEAGFDHYLLKPIEPRALEQFLNMICASRRSALPAPALTA
jgi:two-component system CheB/CheR fusion protein